MNTAQLQEEINKLQSELDKLKEVEAAQSKKWEPEGGIWYASYCGIVGCLGGSEDEIRLFGMERPTEALAEKHVARLRNFNTIAAYVDQYAPDYEFEYGGENYFIIFDYLSDSWNHRIRTSQQCPCTVYMPEHVAVQLINDINSGRVDICI